MEKKTFVSICVIGLMLVSTGISVSATRMGNEKFYNTYDSQPLKKGVTNLTVQEAWDLLNDVSNGIQIPIDVRYDHEWVAAHIDTSYPENPKHHCKCAWEDPSILQDFLDLYDDKEIILYSNNGIRSTEAANTLVTHNFNGFVYNMVDGLDAWIQAGYPTKANSPPNMPIISGESKVKAGQEYQYTFNATDIDEDMIY